jgi:CheY-like chemotaxis protein
MGTLKLPNKYDPTRLLLVDDEPEYIYWLIDYIKAKGLEVTLATNVAEAIAAADETQFRGYIIDLNIPIGAWKPAFSVPEELYEKYKGFYAIKYVRTQGNIGKNVIAYSAHYNGEIKSEIGTLYCDYIAKGRAEEFKTGINEILTCPLPEKLQLGSTREKATAKKASKKTIAVKP